MREQKYIIGKNSLEVFEYIPENINFGSPVIFIHGSWTGAWIWEQYVRILGGRGFKMYTFSLRGHSGSGGEVSGATMQNYVEDVKEVVKYFKIVNPYFVSHAMGGLLSLMYAENNPARALALINPSPSLEILGSGREVDYPAEYTAVEAGMPTDTDDLLKSFPDIPPEVFSKMHKMFAKESGVARGERKAGISVPREKLKTPLLFVGTEDASSVPFGVGVDRTKEMADYYGGEFVEIKGVTHFGALVGEKSPRAVEIIESWFQKIDLRDR